MSLRIALHFLKDRSGKMLLCQLSPSFRPLAKRNLEVIRTLTTTAFPEIAHEAKKIHGNDQRVMAVQASRGLENEVQGVPVGMYSQVFLSNGTRAACTLSEDGKDVIGGSLA